jgi:virginiamycin B lyase
MMAATIVAARMVFKMTISKSVRIVSLLSATCAVLQAQFDGMKAFPLTGISYPGQITEGPDKALWFGTGGSAIGRMTADGTVTEFPFSATSGTGGITVGPDGALWFTFGPSDIGRITTAGAITTYPVPTPNSLPDFVTAGSDGALWFTETGANQIGRITTTGLVTEYPLPSTNSNPTVIVGGPDGALWFIYSYQPVIGTITTSGAVTEYELPFSIGFPVSIVAGPDGALWFPTDLDVGVVGRITTAGTISQYSAPHLSANAITSGPDGALWLTGYTGNIGRMSMTGVFTQYPVPVTGVPWGITAGPDAALWFTDWSANQGSGSILRALACGLGLSVSYETGTLTMNFDVGVMTKATWSAWLVNGNGETALWSKPIDATHPPHPFTFTRSVSAQGNVGVLSALSASGGSFLCTDFQIVNTGGPGPSEDELRREVLQSGLVPALP